jgi:predicted DNA binding CopG/RHH family protein
MKTKRKKSADERLLERYEAGEFVSTSPTKAELKKFQDAARATLAKDRRVNIRLPSSVMMGLQARAAEEGLPYQTLIASVLHKFVTGRLVDPPSRTMPRAGIRSAARKTSGQSMSPAAMRKENDLSKAKRAKDAPHLARLQAE